MSLPTTGAGFAAAGGLPSHIAGITVWNRGDTTLKSGGARQLTRANQEHFSLADDPAFDLGTGDVLLNGFVYLDAVGIQQAIAGKYQDKNNYWLYEVTSGDKLHFIALAGGATVVEVIGATSLLVRTFYGAAVAVDRNSTANTKFYLNGIAEVSGTPTVAATDLSNTGAFALGAAFA